MGQDKPGVVYVDRRDRQIGTGETDKLAGRRDRHISRQKRQTHWLAGETDKLAGRRDRHIGRQER